MPDDVQAAVAVSPQVVTATLFLARRLGSLYRKRERIAQPDCVKLARRGAESSTRRDSRPLGETFTLLLP